MENLIVKIRVILRSIKILKNWYLFPAVYFNLVKNETIVFETRKRMKLKIRLKSTDLMALTNIWLLDEYTKNKFEIKNDDIVIDIGGHIGLFSLFASDKCKAGKIFTYEPDKENFNLLNENIELNKLKNIFSYNIAVSNDKNKVTLFLNDDQSGHSIFKKSSITQIVDSTTLEEIYIKNNLEKCDFLKIDAEGVEFEILESVKEEILGNIKKIIFEYHIFENNYEQRLTKIIEKLERNNFCVEKKPHSKFMGLVYARKKD